MSRKDLKRKVAWALIGAMMLSNTGQAFAAAGWNKDARGWTYESETGSKVAAGWVLDGTTWYHMNKDGYMETGWFQDTDGRWYYLNPNVGGPQGSMMMGWVQDATGKWYYMNPSVGGPQGSMMTGWITENGKKWYLNADGSWDGKEGILVSRSSGGGGSSSGGGGGSTPTVDKMNLRVGDKDNTYGWSYDRTLKTYTVDSGEYTSITVTAEVGNDTVIIENINAATLSVQGGGSNSVILRNTRIATVDMSKDSAAASSEAPRLLLEGTSSVELVSVLKPALLESASKEPVIGAVVAQDTLTVQGSTTNLDKVEALGANALIHISESSVKEMTLSGGAEAMASSGGSVDILKVKDSVMLTNLPVNINMITEGNSTITMQGSTSVPVMEASYPATLISKGDPAQIALVNTNTALTVKNTIVDLVVTSGNDANIKADEKASLNSVLIEDGTLTIESSDNKNINVGKVVANDEVAGFSVGSSVNITEVETKGDLEINGEGTVNVVAAESGAAITGTVGVAATQITVTFLNSFTPIHKTVSYGEGLPVLETKYDTGNGEAQINWPAYTFTSKNPGTYTIVGTWSALPDGVRAGNATPTAVITVNAPDTVSLTFAETSGLTGFDITLTSSDEGEVISKDSAVVTVIKGKTYTYTISKSGYEAASGTVKAEANQSIGITLNAVNEYFSLRFEAPSDWAQYTDRKLPANGNYISGTKLVLPKAHTRAGYDLSWKDDAGNIVSEAVASKNATYTASWTIMEYPIKYVGAEMEGAKETYTVDDNSYTLPQLAMTGDKIFCGWYTTASFAGQPVTTLPKGSTGAKSYYARWITDMEAAGLLENDVPVTGAVSVKVGKLNNVLFAKGAAVAVNAYSKDKNLVTLNGTQYLAPLSLNIYAGDYNKNIDLTATGKITVNDGTVDTIFGGGAGDTVFSTGSTANVTGDVAITVKGGAVRRIYGGGTGRSAVNGQVTIDVQKADDIIDIIYGGGAAPSGSNPGGNQSENHVERAEITIADGVIVNKLIGGGVGIASVNSNKILLNGTVALSMIAAGNNGYTGAVDVTLGSTAHLEAGNAFPGYPQYDGMTIYQAGFRGTLGDVRLTVESGAQIDGDMFLGTNSLREDGENQNAKISGVMDIVFEDGFQCDGDIYLGVGSDGDSLNNTSSIKISGPVTISPMMYSQKFTTTTLDMIPQEIKNKVTMDNGADWGSPFASGTGTEEEPYIIETENQFKLMYSNAAYATGGYTFKLATDIELKQEDALLNDKWSFGNHFKGTLDGDGHTISYAGTDTRVLFDTAGDTAFTNLNVHMNGKGLLGLTYGFVDGSLVFENVNMSGDEPVVVGNNESAYVMVGYHQGNQRLDSLRFTKCINRLDYKTILQKGYAAPFIGGYVYNAAASTTTAITFENCANYGNISGIHPAVFMGNPTYPDGIDLTMIDTYNHGNVTGTTTAALFSRFNNSTKLDKWNDQFKECNQGIISLSTVEGLKLGIDKESQEYLIKDTSDGEYESYVLTLSAYAREVVDADMKPGTCVIGNNWTFTSEQLASASDWGGTGVYAGKFVTQNYFIGGEDGDLEKKDDGRMNVNGEQFAYTLYYSQAENCFYYVFEDETLSLYGCQYELNNTKASAFLYGVDANGDIYGPLDKVEEINNSQGKQLLASPSNAALLMSSLYMEDENEENVSESNDAKADVSENDTNVNDNGSKEENAEDTSDEGILVDESADKQPDGKPADESNEIDVTGKTEDSSETGKDEEETDDGTGEEKADVANVETGKKSDDEPDGELGVEE